MTLGEKLKDLRIKKDMTIREIAKHFNIGKTTYANYEYDQRKPDYEMLKKLAEFHCVSVDYLVGASTVEISAKNDTLGDYLQKLREDKNYSINQLALYSGVSSAHISRIERELREASPEILEKLSKCLDVSHEELMIKAGYISETKRAYTGEELTELVPDEFKTLFEEQNIGYVKFAKEMMKEEIDIDTLKELIEVSKKIRQEYGNEKDKNKDK